MIKAKWIYRFLIPSLIGAGALSAVIAIPLVINRKKHEGFKKNIDIEMDVVKWDTLRDFDKKTFDKTKEIRVWYGRQHQAKMVDFFIDSHWHINETKKYTLGELLDKINKTNGDIFKFNIENSALAGPMGRMLWGVKKTDSYIRSHDVDRHSLYWGVHMKEDHGNWIFDGGSHESFISLRSPNSEYARVDSHNYFDLNESFDAYDNRLSKGVDQIYLSSNDKFKLTTWRMY